MRFAVRELQLFERPVHFRQPFSFGAAALAAVPQAFVRARIELEDGRSGVGGAAELLGARWFEKNPAVAEDEALGQLRASLALARESYLAAEPNTAFGHSIEQYAPQIAMGALQGMSSLAACFGPALIDRALLDALCRALGLSFYAAIEKNVPKISAPGWQADLAAFDMEEYLYGLRARKQASLRHTVGLADPLTSAEAKGLGDGLPETLEEVVAAHAPRWFKLKVSGAVEADLERLAAIAAVLEGSGRPYQTTLDANEQFEGAEAALAFWKRLRADARLKRLLASVAYIEQPVRRDNAFTEDVSELAEERPVIIDESDDSLEAFPLARRRGYTGVSVKACKGFYKAILNSARCRLWNREEGSERYFVSAEDLTTQAGLAVQQDLAVAALLGVAHVERNGHHYVNGMAGTPEAEQQAFLDGHADLYERSHGAVRLRIRDGELGLASLGCPGFASAALPAWDTLKAMKESNGNG